MSPGQSPSSTRRKLLLVGWDSADWKIIQPLVDAGEMPATKYLLENGVSGNLATLEPQLSPMLWTSIATGKHAYHHGVLGFTEVSPEGRVVPVSAATRRCKTLWEMLGEEGRKSHVVGWFATQGERMRNGCMVSNLFGHFRHEEEDAPEDWPPPPPGTYWPEELAAHLNTRRVSPWDIDPDQVLKLFVPRAADVDQTKDDRLWKLAVHLAESASVHAAACWLMENEPDWDLTAVYYRAIDEISHDFMPYHPPRMAGAKEEDFSLYQDVVKSAYRFHDLLLTRLLQLAGPDTAVMLVSDHGFHSDHLRPEFTPNVPAGITVWHRPQGIFAFSAPGVRRDSLVHGARLLDIVPTALTYFGLPVGEDMEGRVLREIFDNAPEVQKKHSWEDAGGFLSRADTVGLSEEENSLLLKQFVDLGYLDAAVSNPHQAEEITRTENQWSLARALMDAGRYEQAMPLLQEIFHVYPERLDYGQMLARCQLRLGLLDEADAIATTCLNGFADPAGIYLIRANIAVERGHADQAMRFLDEVMARQPRNIGCLGLRIEALMRLHQWEECLQTCETLLEADPQNVLGHIGLARHALHHNHPEEAVDHALRATGLQYGNPRGHLLLGIALAQLGEWHPAEQALRISLKLEPYFYPAWRILSRVIASAGKKKEANDILLKMKLLRTEQTRLVKERNERLRKEMSETLPSLIAEGNRRMRERNDRLIPSDSLMPPDQDFVIVSGLPRSGTSLMMQMLKAGGHPLMHDGLRAPDSDNPEGYWEWEDIKKLPQTPLVIEQAAGKATKVISALLSSLPSKHRYRVIFMKRPPAEIVASQEKMLENQGTLPKADRKHLEEVQHKHLQDTLGMLRHHERITLLEVDYPGLMADPELWIQKLVEFLGSSQLPDAASMREVIKPALYRQRR